MDIPHTISYQGILIDRSGQPVPDGIHRMTIRLYVSDSGNVGIYFTQTNVSTKNGIFNVILGAPYTDTLPSSLNLNQPLWLGVQLDNNAEMRPLTPVTGTMYALNVADNSISTEKIQDSAVTIGKILPEFVGSVSAGGSKLTTKGSGFDFEAGRGIGFVGDSVSHKLTINSRTVIDSSIAGNGLSFDSIRAAVNVNADSVTIGITNDTLRVLAMGIANYIAHDTSIWNAIANAVDSSKNIRQSFAYLLSGDTNIWNALSVAIDSSKSIHNAFSYVISHDTSVQNTITNLVVKDIRSDTTVWKAIAQAIDTSKDIHIAILNLINKDTAIRNAITNLVVNDVKTDTNMWNSIAIAIDSSRSIHIAITNLINRDTNVQNAIISVINNAVNNNSTLQNTLNQFISKSDRGRAGNGLSFDTTTDEFNVNVDNKVLTIVNDTLTVSDKGLASVIRTDSVVWNGVSGAIDSSKRIQLSIANLISGDTVIWNSVSIAIDSSKKIDQSIVNLVTRDTSIYNAISNFINNDSNIQNILTQIVNNAIKNDTTLQNTINEVVNKVEKYHAGNGLSYDTVSNTFNVNVDGKTIAIQNDSLTVLGSGIASIIKADTNVWNAIGVAIDTSTTIQNAILNIIGNDTNIASMVNNLIKGDTNRAGNGLSFNSSTKKYDVNVDNQTIGIVNDTLQVKTSGIVNMIKTDTSGWNAIAVSVDSSKTVQQSILNVVLGDTGITNIVTRVLNVLDTSRAGDGLSYDTSKKQFNVNVDNNTISIVNDTLQVKATGIAKMIQTDTNVWNGIAIAIDSSSNIQQSILNVVNSQDTALAGNGLSFNTSTKKIDVNVDNKTLQIANDTLSVKPFGITSAQLDSNAVTTDKIADSTILGRDIQIPLDLERSTPGTVLIANNSADNTGGNPVIRFSGSSSDGTPTFRVTGSVTGGALAEFKSTASSSEALLGIIAPAGAASSTIEGLHGEVNPGAVSATAPLYGVHGKIDSNVQATLSAGVYGEATSSNGTVYGVVGTSVSNSFSAAGVFAGGNGAASAGVPNAAALEINNGAIRVSGALQPVGTQSTTIPIGMRTVKVTVNNSLAQTNSYIQVSVNGNGGSVTLGTDHDTFSAIVRSKNAGSFIVEISCDQGNVPSAEAVTLDYIIVNQ